MPEMMYSGCICGYSALNFDKIFMLCKGSGTCICLEEKACLAAGEPQFPVGMIKEDGFICKVGLPCCTLGLKTPDTKDLISSDTECLCIRSVAQFPFGDKGVCMGPSLSPNRIFLIPPVPALLAGLAVPARPVAQKLRGVLRTGAILISLT